MDELNRPDINATRRLCSHQRTDIARKLPGNDDLLLVAPRKRSDRSLRVRRSDIKPAHKIARLITHRLGLHDQPSRKRRTVVAIQDHVLLYGERKHKSVSLPVFWNVGKPSIRTVAYRRTGQVAVTKMERSRLGCPKTGYRLDEFGLAIPLHASDTHDLACPNRQRHTIDSSHPAVIVHYKVANDDHRFTRNRPRLLHTQENITPYHQGCKRLWRGVARQDLSSDRAPPHHDDPVG